MNEDVVPVGEKDLHQEITTWKHRVQGLVGTEERLPGQTTVERVLEDKAMVTGRGAEAITAQEGTRGTKP